jgi:ATP-binding cassette subfamily B protein
MDCGPAVLKCLLEGFGIPAHYGRLREACQTDVDGTSIDTLESVACQLGLAAEQVMVPVDHLLLPEAEALPAILVVCLPDGLTHFVLVWRRHGPFVQVMDPGVGRRWLRGRRLLEEVYVHSHRLPAEAWMAWAVGPEFRGALARRLRALGLGGAAGALLDKAAASPGWPSLARLDAATRLTASLVGAGGVRRGREARHVLQTVLERAAGEVPGEGPVLPGAYWSVLPAPPDPGGPEQVLVRGAVLVRVPARAAVRPPPGGTADAAPTPPLGADLTAALTEPALRPGRTLVRLLGGGGLLPLISLAGALVLAAAAAVLEPVLLRGAIDVGRDLGLLEQRLAAVGYLLAFVGALLLLEGRVADGLVRLGRRLENRLRVRFLERIPRLHDRYFQSRPVSDMAERGHSLYQVRTLPRLAGQFLRAGLALGLTAAALAWADPAGAGLAFGAAALAVVLPLGFLPVLGELDLRVRTHAGALSRVYLDVLLGLLTVRAHGAERAVRREHEALLTEWAGAGARLLRWAVLVEGLQVAAGVGLAGALLFLHAGRAGDSTAVLLLAYWALSIPVLAEEIALLARQYPHHRNVTLRLLEPLGAAEDEAARGDDGAGATSPGGTAPAGVALRFESVTVRAAGHTILHDADWHIEAGSQVAIVGVSGAGKSSLVGLLLGWHRAASGRVLVDQEPLDAGRLDRLRDETAWVDPAVQLWNRSLAENLL